MLAETLTPAIECRHVSRSFGEFHAVHDISLKLPQNAIVGIAGANGAGKTTLVKLVAGLLRPTSGEILARGSTIKDSPREYFASMGLLLDESFLYDDLSLHDNYEFHTKLHGRFDKVKHEELLHHLAQLFKLSDWLYEPARILSRGMRKKADIIRMFLHEPKVVLLDEPFANLDVSSVQVLVSLLRQARDGSGTASIISSHDIPIIKDVCDEIVVLKKGRINKILSRSQFNEVPIDNYL
jgi:ABC-type multidrug transport system ATPase subunit